MADFLLLFRGDGPQSQGFSPDEMQKHMEQWGSWIGGLNEKGSFKAGDPLDAGGKVLTGADKVLTDGPYAESKDVVGGYVIVSASDIDAATEISKGCPIFDTGGSLEVRPVRPMQP